MGVRIVLAVSALIWLPYGVFCFLQPGALADSGLTTPGPLALQESLGEMAAQGIDRVAMEVSSHALDQQRLDRAQRLHHRGQLLGLRRVQRRPDLGRIMTKGKRTILRQEIEIFPPRFVKQAKPRAANHLGFEGEHTKKIGSGWIERCHRLFPPFWGGAY